MVGRKGWQRVGERLVKGWRRVGEELAKGFVAFSNFAIPEAPVFFVSPWFNILSARKLGNFLHIFLDGGNSA